MDGVWEREPKNGTAVVFIHGIFSSGERCWKNENGAYWPRLLVEEDFLSDIGVYVYSYKANPFSGDYSIGDVVDDLKERGRLDRVFENRNVVFVCHSMGGIVVRKLLVERASYFSKKNVELGLFLVASPSLGSRYANWLKRLAKIAGNSQAQALRFHKNNNWLNDLDRSFINLRDCGELSITGKELVEDHFFRFKRFFRTCVVEAFSGARYFGESYKVPNSDHSTIAKPADRSAMQHRLLCEYVETIQDHQRNVIESRVGESMSTSSSAKSTEVELSPQFSEYLRSTDIKFEHREKESLGLEDIFVYPDLTDLSSDIEDGEVLLSSNKLITRRYNRVLLLGEEQSGKTALAKKYFSEFFSDGYFPLLIDCSGITSTDVSRVIKSGLTTAYSDISVDAWLSSSRKKVIILDNFDGSKLNATHRQKFVTNCIAEVDILYVISDSNLKFSEKDMSFFGEFHSYEMRDFGFVKRGELIEKWCSVGVAETITEASLAERVDHLSSHVDSVVRKNIVPSKPLYLIAILQVLETSRPNDFKLTSYGHCYQFLISSALMKAKIPADTIDAFLNYLTSLAECIYSTGGFTLTDEQFQAFRSAYQNAFILPDRDIETLRITKILTFNSGAVWFSHKFVFYFFAAKHFSENLHDPLINERLDELCENIHTDRNANVLIFLTHHSKSQDILNRIIDHTTAVFPSQDEATLSTDDTNFMIEVLDEIPDLVLEQRDVSEERQKHLERKDAASSALDDDQAAQESGEQILVDISRSIRAIELVGQILRNRYGSLNRGQLEELAESAYSVGLRFLRFYLELVSQNEQEFIHFIQKLIGENKNLTDGEIAKRTRKFYLHFCYGMTFAIIKKISTSTGHRKLIDILEGVSSNHPDSVAIKLINLVTKLENSRKLPKKYIKSLAIEFSSNAIALRMLREVVLKHCYLHYTSFGDKQWISSTLDIPVDAQNLIDVQSRTKAHRK